MNWVFQLLFTLLAFPSLTLSAADLQNKMYDLGATVVFVPHALAPQINDPKDFNITDCSTQRNLNKGVIAQAKLNRRSYLFETKCSPNYQKRSCK